MDARRDPAHRPPADRGRARGVKGAGEGGINAVGAAIASAIDAAIGISGAIDRR